VRQLARGFDRIVTSGRLALLLNLRYKSADATAGCVSCSPQANEQRADRFSAGNFGM